MKNLLFILLLLFLLGFSNLVRSQQSQIKFMAYTAILYNQVSLSYEYSINEKHSIGVQVYGYVGLYPDIEFYYVYLYSASGVRFSYRFYKGITIKQNNNFIFFQGEIGYYSLRDEFAKIYRSTNTSTGFMVGIRKKFGNSDKWFVDFALGASIDYRMYKSHLDVPHYEIDYGSNPKPADSFYFMPRLLIEVGVKL